MSGKEILKWGAIIIVGLLVLRWLSAYLTPQLPDVPGGELWGSGWAAPIAPQGPVVGWSPWWNYGGGFGSYRGRGGRSGRASY